jgi:hypothetical protein
LSPSSARTLGRVEFGQFRLGELVRAELERAAALDDQADDGAPDTRHDVVSRPHGVLPRGDGRRDEPLALEHFEMLVQAVPRVTVRVRVAEDLER